MDCLFWIVLGIFIVTRGLAFLVRANTANHSGHGVMQNCQSVIQGFCFEINCSKNSEITLCPPWFAVPAVASFVAKNAANHPIVMRKTRPIPYSEF